MSTLDRTQSPPIAQPKPLHLPLPSSRRLLNGVLAHYLEAFEHEILCIEVIFEAGRWSEEQLGVAHFTAHMLEKGTVSHNAAQIANRLDHYGAQLQIESGFDFSSIKLNVLTQHAVLLLPLLFELLSKPSFLEAELSRLGEQFAQDLSIRNAKTDHLASKLIRKKIFGETHPYGRSVEEADVRAIRRAQLLAFFQGQMRPMHVFVLGRPSPEVQAQIDDFFGSLPAPKAPSAKSFNITNDRAAQWVEQDGNVQSSIRMGKQAIDRTHPDYPHFLLLNYYLGGYFGSRLMQSLREDKGLTYGIYSSLVSLKRDSMLLIASEVKKEQRTDAIEEIRKELRALSQQGQIGEEELELAKRHFIGGQLLSIASPFAVMQKVKNLLLYHLPVDFYSQLIDHVRAAKEEELHEVAKQYFDPDSFCEASVG